MDLFFFNVIHSLAGRLSLLDGLAIFFSKYLVYFLILGALFFVFKFKSTKEKIFASLVIVMTAIISRGILTELVRFIYDRRRPYEALGFEPLFLDTNPSFPSGHAALLFALAIAIFYFNRRWGWWFLSLSLLVGISRIFVGIHWPTDILGGIIVGLASFLVVKNLLKSYEPKKEAT